MTNYEFSKYEIATYLRDYNWLMLYAMGNPNIRFYKLFSLYMFENGRGQYAVADYYYEMISVYEMFVVSKYLTILYDNFFDHLLDASIDELNIPDSIFVNTKDRKQFSKKNIIRNIRNAFNHNDNPNHDLLKLVRVNENGHDVVKAEIFLKNTNPIPFHVMLDVEQLMLMSSEIYKANTLLLMSFRSSKPIFLHSSNVNETMNNMFLRKFYSRKKLSDDQIKELRNHIDMNHSIRFLEKLFLDKGMEYKDYKFDIAQKVKIKEELKYWESVGVNGNDVINHLMRIVMPLSGLKDKGIVMNLTLANFYVRNVNKSLSDLVNEASKVLLKGSYDADSPFCWYVESYGLDNNLLYDAKDFDNLSSITNSIYYGFLFETLVMDKDIKINETKTIERKKIRDAFVHMRWFRGINECYKLYDWNYGIDNEFNKESPGFWKANVRFMDMYKCAESYYYSALKIQNINVVNIDFPIHFKKSVFGGESSNYTGVSFIKTGVFYYYDLERQELLVAGDDQIQRVANNSEIQIFVKELDNLTDKEKNDFANEIVSIKNMLVSQNDIGVKHNKL